MRLNPLLSLFTNLYANRFINYFQQLTYGNIISFNTYTSSSTFKRSEPQCSILYIFIVRINKHLAKVTDFKVKKQAIRLPLLRKEFYLRLTIQEPFILERNQQIQRK